MGVHEMMVHCPVCGGPLEIVRTRCERCDVAVEGRFRMLEFNRLSPAHLDLLRLFIRSRGNLKEMGRIVGVSYPTIRARFEDLLAALGYEAGPPEHDGGGDDERRGVLDALERGEISAAEATQRLQRAAGGHAG